MFPVGQLFVAGFDGTTVPAGLAQLLRDEELAGVILFRRNITSVKQLMALTAQLKDVAGRPILIAVDHEGGRVFRMPPPFTSVPPMATVGAAARCHPEGDLAYNLGALMGRELAAVGINIDFAPVLDLNTNPDNPIIGDRAFNADPKIVAELGCRMIRGLQDGGVIPCGKHFPGHGDTPEDSHLTMPIMPATWDRLRTFELVPFKAAIEVRVPMLMTAHILYHVIDPELPVTLSRRAIFTLLREELRYQGVVVTDDLQMGAIARHWPVDEASIRALAAGCDLVLICKDLAATKMAIASVREAVRGGMLSEEFLEQALSRVRGLLQQSAQLPPPPSYTVIGCRSHREVVSQTGMSFA
ncbi:MAG: beta-N-acetylhexosaminidase [Deltaproteobacteria bacterium]|nr:beta-N-acetylhexosaminidase [Deltaproteobacteria bacterium]